MREPLSVHCVAPIDVQSIDARAPSRHAASVVPLHVGSSLAGHALPRPQILSDSPSTHVRPITLQSCRRETPFASHLTIVAPSQVVGAPGVQLPAAAPAQRPVSALQIMPRSAQSVSSVMPLSQVLDTVPAHVDTPSFAHAAPPQSDRPFVMQASPSAKIDFGQSVSARKPPLQRTNVSASTQPVVHVGSLVRR